MTGMACDTSPKLLLVDDDAALCAALARGFTARGFDVGIARDQEEAEELVAREPFDYAVIDLRLAAGEGLALVSVLHARAPAARIVVLTGYSSVPTAVEAIKRGATYYLAKPATVAEIMAAFEHVPGAALPIAEKPMSLPRLEWEHIQRVLHANDGNISAAARALSMHRRTLQRKLAKHPAKQ
jgi:two-component system response regulator RegA